MTSPIRNGRNRVTVGLRALSDPAIEASPCCKRVNRFGTLDLFLGERMRSEVSTTLHQPDRLKNRVQLESFTKSASTPGAPVIGTPTVRLERFQVVTASCKRFPLIASSICAVPDNIETRTRQRCIWSAFERNAKRISVPNLSRLRALNTRFSTSSRICALRIGLASEATPTAACV